MQTFIVNRNTNDLAENQKRQIELMTGRISHLHNEIIIYNCEEEPFQGKLRGHYRALQEYQNRSCNYYWFNHPDLSFAIDMDCLLKLLTFMEKNPWIGVISPTEDSDSYQGMFKHGYRWHPVAACNYLSLLIRASVIEEIGFMNPDFIYCWGAIHEYSNKLYKNGWCVAYCDIAKMHHFGGTTYGKAGAVSRETYQKKAKEFARNYFIENYGRNWDKEFAKALPEGVINVYSAHKKQCEERQTCILRLILGKTFKYIMQRYLGRFCTIDKNRNSLRLYLGCGQEKRKEWVNIDIDKQVKPNIVANIQDLNMFEDEAAVEIECCSLFEHLNYSDVAEAVKEWHRVLRKGGKLSIKLNNSDSNWEIKSLTNELRTTGFRALKEITTTQENLPAKKWTEAMRFEYIK